MARTPEGPAPIPPWWQPPRDAVPAVLPLVTPLVRTSTAALTLVGAHVYRQGIELLLERRVRRRVETDDEWQAMVDDFHEIGERPAVSVGSERLRYSVVANGVEVFANSLFDGHSNANDEPLGLSVMRTRLGSSGSRWFLESSGGLWLWPLPTVDHLELVARWPAAGIPCTSVAIQTSDLAEISQRSTPLWGTTAPQDSADEPALR